MTNKSNSTFFKHLISNEKIRHLYIGHTLPYWDHKLQTHRFGDLQLGFSLPRIRVGCSRCDSVRFAFGTDSSGSDLHLGPLVVSSHNLKNKYSIVSLL